MHHRFLLDLHLTQLEQLEAAIQKIDERIEETVCPLHEAAERLTTIPGIAAVAAMVIVSEIGTDMTRFPSAGHLLSWAGLCPRLDESAGKKRSTRIRNGALWLKTTLVQCAWAATRKKNCYYGAQYHRIKGRRGHKKVLIAVAASILTAIYHMLSDQTVHKDLGSDHFAKRDNARIATRLCKRLEQLGYEVELKKAS